MKPTKSLIGVNLGGWLVLERWMTPSVFNGTDAQNEYELSRTQEGRRAIQNHRQTFITERDIAWLARVGVEAVRLPLGYWLFMDDEEYVPARNEVEWLMAMAEKYNLKVLLCLHAAPGAQNANDHSGSGMPGKTGWHGSRARRKATKKVLKNIAEQYAAHPALWGIQLLNEPLIQKWRHKWQLWWWTRRTVKMLRPLLPPHVRLVVSDCYNPAWWSGRVGEATLDIHHYQCFSASDTAATTYAYHAKKLQKKVTAYQHYQYDQPIIIGEWSATLPPRTMSDENTRRFCQAQLATDTGADAWFFWSYKTEHTGSWNFYDCYKKGYFDGILEYNEKNEENSI